MSFSSEKELIQSIRAGDKQAFECFYKQYYKRLYTFVLFLINSEEAAEDITQEAFTRLWEKRESLDEAGSLNGFVRQMSKHLVYDHCRKAKVKRSFEEQLGPHQMADDLLEKIHHKELEHVLKLAMSCLTPEKQAMFRQSRFENKTYAEIARNMGTTPKAVERHMAKSLSFIKKYLFKYSKEVISTLTIFFLR